MQDLFKLLLRRGGIAAVQVSVTLTARLAAAPFAEVVLHFAILRVALHPGIVKRLISRLRPHPQQRLTQSRIGFFAAAGLGSSMAIPSRRVSSRQVSTLPGPRAAVFLRMLSDVLTQFAQRLRIERFVAGHRHIVFRRQSGRRNAAVEHTPPGRQRGRHVAAARLLSGQVELPLRDLGHFFGAIQILQAGTVGRRFLQSRPPLGRGLQVAPLLRPQRHQVQRLSVVGIHR